MRAKTCAPWSGPANVARSEGAGTTITSPAARRTLTLSISAGDVIVSGQAGRSNVPEKVHSHSNLLIVVTTRINEERNRVRVEDFKRRTAAEAPGRPKGRPTYKKSS